MKLKLVGAFATIAILCSFNLAPAQALTAPPLPTTYAAAGDSISRAFDVNSSCFLKDCPAYSWATGTVAANQSISVRIQSALASSGKTLTSYNVAKTGAMMKDLDAQLVTAKTYNPQFVSIMMGANDVCTKTIAGMTPTATFQTQFETAMTKFTSNNPTAFIYVSSIPNIYTLYSTFSKSTSAKSTWALFGICQSMLSSRNTEAQRQQVLTQLKADNQALADVCLKFSANCRYDGGATFNTVFTATDVSTVDYFHPSVAGQVKLAQTAWTAGYWPTP